MAEEDQAAGPAAVSTLVLKSSEHYRADFQPVARALLEVEAQAPNVADNRQRPHKNLRPGLRIMPGGPVYEPVAGP